MVERGLEGNFTDFDDDLGLHTQIVNRVEKELIAQVMLSCDNVQTKAASRLGINRNTLHKKLKDYNIEGSDLDASESD